MSFTVTFCASCRAPIIWAISEHGNAMPVNARVKQVLAELDKTSGDMPEAASSPGS